MWRFYYVSHQTSQLEELICPDCCSKSTPSWKSDLNGPVVSSPDGGITVTNISLPRIVYYLDSDGTIRELNNTLQYSDEACMTGVSSSDGVNTGIMANPNATVGPAGSVVTTGIFNGKLGMSVGFRGIVQQL